jgi:hypothetical protein
VTGVTEEDILIPVKSKNRASRRLYLHPAYTSLNQNRVGDYTVKILTTNALGITGILVRDPNHPIRFEVNGAEDRFTVPSVLQDIELHFHEVIRNRAQMPVPGDEILRWGY